MKALFDAAIVLGIVALVIATCINFYLVIFTLPAIVLLAYVVWVLPEAFREDARRARMGSRTGFVWEKEDLTLGKILGGFFFWALLVGAFLGSAWFSISLAHPPGGFAFVEIFEYGVVQIGLAGFALVILWWLWKIFMTILTH